MFGDVLNAGPDHATRDRIARHFALRAIVARRGIDQHRDRYVDDDLRIARARVFLEGIVAGRSAADEATGVGHGAHDRHVEVPFLADLEDVALAAVLGHHQHALLRFGEQHLVRRQQLRAAGDGVEVQLDTIARAARHLDRRRCQARGAHVLHALQAIAREDLEASFEQQFLHERIADLDGGQLLLTLLVEFRGRHRRAVNAVAPGLAADVKHRIAESTGAPEK
jgi:hypothetical protein